MPKRIAISSKEYLKTADLPEKTETYTVIPHSFVMDTTERILSEKGFSIVKEHYKCNEGGQIAKGIYYLNAGDDPDIKMMVAWANSYDKSMRFKFAVGAYLMSSESCMLAEHVGFWNRKHTGTADKETADMIEGQLNKATDYYNQMVADKEAMKLITLSRKEAAELIGRLFLDLQLLTSEQINIIKEQYRNASFDYGTNKESLWALYCHTIYSLKKAHPKNWLDQQRLIHLFFSKEFGFGKIIDLMKETPVTEPVVTEIPPVFAEPIPQEKESFLKIVVSEDTPQELSAQESAMLSLKQNLAVEKVTTIEPESVVEFEERSNAIAPTVTEETPVTEVADALDSWFCLECNTEQKPTAVFHDGQLCESCYQKQHLTL